jgi:hypothetical protein
MGIATVVDNDAPAVGSLVFKIEGNKLKTARPADRDAAVRFRKAYERWQSKRRIHHLQRVRLKVDRIC